MSQKGDARDDLVFETKCKAKEFLRQASKFQKEEEKFMQRAREELKQNDQETAKLYANQACSFSAKATQFRRLAAQMDTAANSLKKADMMDEFQADMGQVVQALQKNDLSPENIRCQLMQFNKLTNELNIGLSAMEIDTDIVVDDKANELLQQLQVEVAHQAVAITQPEIIEDNSKNMNTLMQRIDAI